MPARDAAHTITAAIQSVCEQTFEDWELLVVNDSSRDHTAAVANSFAASDPRCRLLHAPSPGIVAALNEGLAQSRAPWIARIDADDLMPPRRLELQLEHARKNPDLDLVSGWIIHGGDEGGFSRYIDWLNALSTPEDICLKRFIESPVAHPSVIFRRELPERLGGYCDGDFPEDYELWLRWLGGGARFGKIPHPVLIWNDSPGRLTRIDPRYGTDRFYRLKLRHLAHWLKREVAPDRGIWLWGAGRVTRRRFESIADHGIRIAGHIDIDPRKCGPRRDGLRVILPDALPPPSDAFIIAGVASRGARERIARDLESHGYLEGRDFIHAA